MCGSSKQSVYLVLQEPLLLSYPTGEVHVGIMAQPTWLHVGPWGKKSCVAAL